MAAFVLCALAFARPARAEVLAEPVAPQAWMRCWTQNGGLPPGHVAAAQTLLGGDSLVTGLAFRGAPSQARLTASIPVAELLASEVPLWRAVTVEAQMQPGEVLSLTHGVNACLPYPVKSIALTPQPMVRGQTALLVLETERMAFCEAGYLGQSENCYRDGATHFIVPVGVSALEDPGVFALRIALMVGGEKVDFSLPIGVAGGRYGYQFINPPPALSGLMDPDKMASELEYLAQWRTIRSAERLWDLPLGFPLQRSVPISADYGDRRSYGGMVDGYHSGVDYRAWGGMPVLAPADGVVVMAEALAVRGNAVLLDHGWGLITGYWHLSRIDVQVGDRVQRGQPFALVGSTGLSTGAHLHWEVWANGVSVDGKQWLREDAFNGVGVPDRERDAAGAE
ncbi:MAG: M23 family metallopeptidase [Anaerolineae bacterium]|nr:M23 family metallopeptidase [Anaerolineae bacterium]